MTAISPIRVILVEDDADVRVGCAQALSLAQFEVLAFESAEGAAPHITPGAPVVLVCDVWLPGTSGISWLPRLRQQDPDLPVILITGQGDIAMAVQAMREGAYDFISKPFGSAQLVDVVRRAIDKRRLTLRVLALQERLQGQQDIESLMVGDSDKMVAVRQTVMALAANSVDVVVYGETGTGKELVARALHGHSARRDGNFVALNCGGLSETLAESELFGHEVGAFTGASRQRTGKLEHAHRGTLFLDEIESMPLSVQIKLLRALQERSIERLGSHRSISIDTRIVAASKDDLRSLSEQQRFRADLYYRIGVAFIELPPLRERREDIPLLFEHFTLQSAQRFKREAPVPSSATLGALMQHAWPGNVRELRNVADRFVLGLTGAPLAAPGDTPDTDNSLPSQVQQFERAVISESLREHGGDVMACAAALGLPKQTLYDKLRRLGMTTQPFRPKKPA
jgi:two-component system C4-dicarboxylate transport response regulator DctD